MQDNKSFFELDNSGAIHYVHCDSYSIFLIYEDTEDDKLYSLCLDKDFIVTSASVVKTPVDVKAFEFNKWHKPSLDNYNETVFKGCLTIGKEQFKFSITGGELTLGKTVSFQDSLSFPTLECLKDIEVDAHVQKANFLYLIGWDKVKREQVFIETNIGETKASRRYTLASDKGDVTLHSISLDPWSSRIYIVGETIACVDDKLHITPYLETLCYRKPNL